MRIVRQWQALNNHNHLTMTIGNFDGIHKGHHHLIQKLLTHARKVNGIAAIMTFSPHPVHYLKPDKLLTLLTSRHEKMRRLANLGIDVLYLLRFDEKLANLSPEQFTDRLFNTLNVRHLIIGSDFRYGYKAKGDFSHLQQVARKYHAKVECVDLLTLGEKTISSGRLRQCLAQSDFKQATQLLGRPWTVSGWVRRGQKFGRQLGYPTANLKLPFLPPCAGIYAADACIDYPKKAPVNKTAAVSIGINPTVQNDNLLKVEAHLLDFDDDIYDLWLTLTLHYKLRDEEKYHSIEDLKKAIAFDVAQTRQYFQHLSLTNLSHVNTSI